MFYSKDKMMTNPGTLCSDNFHFIIFPPAIQMIINKTQNKKADLYSPQQQHRRESSNTKCVKMWDVIAATRDKINMSAADNIILIMMNIDTGMRDLCFTQYRLCFLGEGQKGSICYTTYRISWFPFLLLSMQSSNPTLSKVNSFQILWYDYII